MEQKLEIVSAPSKAAACGCPAPCDLVMAPDLYCVITRARRVRGLLRKHSSLMMTDQKPVVTMSSLGFTSVAWKSTSSSTRWGTSSFRNPQ